MARQTKTLAKPLPGPKRISVEDLDLDHENPRLAGLNLTAKDQERILGILWRDRAVNEVVDSIASSGFWEHEELFATREGGRLIVVEGNRRLAAVKLLLDDDLRQRLKIPELPKVSSEIRKQCEALPVIECGREDIWQFIGFKHVNGPQDWDSIAKAQYIARVHEKYKISLDDIARTIGDRHATVKRLYRGLTVLRQAEKAGIFDREDRFHTKFFFSHLWTGIGYGSVQEFLGLSGDKDYTPDPVPKRNLPNLKEFLRWLYGSKSDSTPPVIKSQNPDLRILDTVISTKNGIAALRSGLPLEISLKAGLGQARLLREALVHAEQRLKDARGLVLTGYKGDPDLLNMAETIRTLGIGIHDEMQEISGRGRRQKGS